MKSPSLLMVSCGFALLFAAGCGPIDLEGGWTGTWRTKDNSESGYASMGLIQDGETVTGTFNLSSACVETGSVDGTIDDQQLTATLRDSADGVIQADTRVLGNEDRITGDFEVTSGACVGALGVLELDRN